MSLENFENKTVSKEPQILSNGAPESKKISRSKDHFELKTIQHNEKTARADISDKEWFRITLFSSNRVKEGGLLPSYTMER